MGKVRGAHPTFYFQSPPNSAGGFRGDRPIFSTLKVPPIQRGDLGAIAIYSSVSEMPQRAIAKDKRALSISDKSCQLTSGIFTRVESTGSS